MGSRRITILATALAITAAATMTTTTGPVAAEEPVPRADGPPEGAVLFFPQSGGPGVAFWNGQRGERDVERVDQVLIGNFDADGFDEGFGYGRGDRSDLHVWPSIIDRADGPLFYVGLPHSLVSGDYVPLVGDFGGPTGPGGRSIDDILWYAPGRARDTLWIHGADGVAIKSHPRIDGHHRPVVLEGDGFEPESILWYAPGRAADSIWDFRGVPTGAHRTHPLRVDGDYQPTSIATDDARLVHWYSPTGFDATWRLDSIGAAGFRYRELTTPQIDGYRTPIAVDRGATAGVFLYAGGPAQDLFVGTTDASGSALTASATFQVWGRYPNIVAGDVTSATPGRSDGVDELIFGADGDGRGVMWRMPTIDTRVETVYDGLPRYTLPAVVATELPPE